jgi:hypothetical protein
MGWSTRSPPTSFAPCFAMRHRTSGTTIIGTWRRHLVDHAFAWFPLARRSTAALRLALERWGDEAAAAAADRGVLRGALSKLKSLPADGNQGKLQPMRAR